MSIEIICAPNLADELSLSLVFLLETKFGTRNWHEGETHTAWFTYRDNIFAALFHPEDPQVLGLSRLGFYSLPTEADLNRVNQVCLDVSSETNLVKVFTTDGTGEILVHASVNLLLESANELTEAKLERCFTALQQASESFLKQMIDAPQSKASSDADRADGLPLH